MRDLPGSAPVLDAVNALPLRATERVAPVPGCSAMDSEVVFDPAAAAWVLGMAAAGVIGGALTISVGAVALFVGLTAVTLCLGHSVGMHRLLIHRSFEAPRWVEHILAYLGTLVGMAGPIGITRLHEVRDWMQAQGDCADFAKHSDGFWRDLYVQLLCRRSLRRPPRFEIEPRLAEDPVHRFLEATWRWQQIPLAILLYALGGWGFVFWGVCLRVAVSLIGHWVVGWLAHTHGATPYGPQGAAVEGRNLVGLGWLTFGEAWHNNHHAYPRSARLGHRPGETDAGWIAIQSLAALGLAWNLRTPDPAQPPFAEREAHAHADPIV